MVFKRREKRTVWALAVEGIWPRAGWRRAFEYVKHRVRRLPDTPEKIARGLWAGVFASFTPFFGLHFIIAILLAKLMRGNVLSSLLGTFFGNPLTLVPISFSALNTGYFLLGTRPSAGLLHALPDAFGQAWKDLWHNVLSVFTDRTAEWAGLALFYEEVFLPYLVGGIIPGIIAATVCYLLCVPLVAAYQNARRNRLRDKLAQLQKKPVPPADDSGRSG